MKGKRILLSAIFMVVIAILLFSTNSQAASDKNVKLRAVRVREGFETTPYSYKVYTTAGQKPVMKIVEVLSGGTLDYRRPIFCLKAGIGFGSDSGTLLLEGIYNTYYDMVQEIESIKSDLKISDQNYNSILWLLDNVYLPKQDDISVKNNLLQQAFAKEFEAGGDSNWGSIDDIHLTDDDIEVVEQLAIWYFANSPENPDPIHTEYHMDRLESIFVSKTDFGTYVSLATKGPYMNDFQEGDWRVKEANILYKYLIDTAKTKGSYQSNSPMIISLIDENLTVKQVQDGVNSYYKIGPFQLDKEGNLELSSLSDYILEASLVDQDENPLEYKILDKQNPLGTTVSRTLKEAVGKGDIYIRIEKNSQIEDVNFTVKCIPKATTKTYLTTNLDDTVQPVAVVERQLSYGSFQIHIPKFDLSLRKTIESVTRDGSTISIPNPRTISVNTSPLKNNDTTAEYKHRKDPVKVETGDIVKYKLTVYNEGEIDGKATKIVDYLPEGLRLKPQSEINTRYGWTQSGNTITTDYLKDTLIRAYTGGSSLDSKYVEVECEVTYTVRNGEEPKVLTNIAEIKEAYNEGNFDDRDSQPNNLRQPANWPNYAGENNDSDLSRTDYYYKGQQDDDDFEKLLVSTPQFDLALRKYITKVTRKGVVQNIDELGGRIPSINVNPLISSNTTAEYKHRKDPVPVQTGDIVEYTLRIYNEGDIAGRATEIVDYLPDGLKYIGNEYKLGENSNNQYDFSYNSVTNTVTIKAKSEYKNNLKAYEGEREPAYETITLLCEVTKKEDKTIAGDTILTNIAEITEAYNYRDEKMYLEGDDRDSEPGNIPIGLNSPEYKGNNSNKNVLNDSTYFYKGQQDDDDFEKLKVTTPEYDLALRKYITHINGVAVDKSGMTEYDKRKPTYHTEPLQAYLNGDKRAENTTAIYNHSKEPLVVKPGDIIRYKIEVYNEGSIDGCVTSIQDYLPEELEFVPKASSATDTDPNKSIINFNYNWNGTGRLFDTQILAGNTIEAYKPEENPNYLDSKYVEIECRVKEDAEPGKILTNIAAIIGDNGDDRDSDPNESPIVSDTDLPNYADHQEDDDDYEKVVVYKSGYDLALRKFITKVIDGTTGAENSIKTDTTKDISREPVPTKVGETIQYIHPKAPVIVKPGDRVIYTIRIYNEGDTDGTATLIEDYLPEELELVEKASSATDTDPNKSIINFNYKWEQTGRLITTSYLESEGKIIEHYNGGDVKDKNNLHFEDVQIECWVKQNAVAGTILTNIAQISNDDGDDKDSTPNNVRKPSDTDLPNYADHQEDDDDYEKVKIYQPPYDLALRKFITQINDKNITSRIPVVDKDSLKELSEGNTNTATYIHPKDPLLVRNGDIVVYTIRVYNEGKVDGYAEEIKDNIPEGLEFIITNEINAEYRWSLSQDQKTVSTDYLSKNKEVKNGENCIKAFDATKMDDLDYRDVKIAFKVVEPNTSTRVLTNIAEIKEDDGQDRDSTPDNDKKDEDDIDIENVKLRYFDLALRKFITKVESKTGENIPVETDTTKDVSREPKVEIDSNGNIKYVHPKDPVVVSNTDIVIYTLRVYNEGTIDGYAEEVKDNIPDGLEFVLDHEVNTKYGWVMYGEDGKVTNDVTKAKTIRTTYLSQERDENNIIKQFDRDTMTTPDYKDVQVAFRVVEKNVGEDRVIINMAEISKDSDDDEDSTPDNDNPDEDDIDKEYVKVKYFDLSLLKWVSKVSVTRNGKTEVLETGYNGLENPDPVVKTEIKSSEIKTVVVKYEYGIRITNEGQIPGYAKEITDYVPGGLEFIPADNPLWTVKDDGRIATRQLENTLLQPGESAVVNVVFKWINGENNFGIKENVAEISEDYNEKDSKDIDSTPDNKIPGEDDIDNALVILNPKTGAAVVFIVLPTIVLAILSIGIVLIKKYVM